MTRSAPDSGYSIRSRALRADEIGELLDSLDNQTSSTRLLLERPHCARLAAELGQRVPEIADLVPVLATYFYKSSGHNWSVAPHQDLQIPVADNSIGNWDNPTTKENVPFVQAPEVVLRQCRNVRLQLDSHSEGDLLLRVHGEESLVPLAIGDALIFSPLQVHASRKLQGDATTRRVIQLLYGPAQLPKPYTWFQFSGKNH